MKRIFTNKQAGDYVALMKKLFNKIKIAVKKDKLVHEIQIDKKDDSSSLSESYEIRRDFLILNKNGIFEIEKYRSSEDSIGNERTTTYRHPLDFSISAFKEWDITPEKLKKILDDLR